MPLSGKFDLLSFTTPAKQDGLIQMEMYCVSLKDRQYFEYDALSYACGDSIIETARNNQQVADCLLQLPSPTASSSESQRPSVG